MTEPAATLRTRAAAAGLCVLGVCPADPADALPEGVHSIALLGPDDPGFWDVFTGSPEHADGLPDPLDRWSARVIGQLAADLGAVPLFPFGEPPYRPFIAWALRSGQFFEAPVPLLVHVEFGLMASFRGALALRTAPEPQGPAHAPCETCAGQPCRTACPVGALVPGGYDVPACRAHVRAPEGTACRSGCLVRRACPVGQGLQQAQRSAFHMQAFLGRDT